MGQRYELPVLLRRAGAGRLPDHGRKRVYGPPRLYAGQFEPRFGRIPVEFHRQPRHGEIPAQRRKERQKAEAGGGAAASASWNAHDLLRR